jgi:hypothetical protein
MRNGYWRFIIEIGMLSSLRLVDKLAMTIQVAAQDDQVVNAPLGPGSSLDRIPLGFGSAPGLVRLD